MGIQRYTSIAYFKFAFQTFKFKLEYKLGRYLPR
jgi:hypothetical protein